MIYAQLAYGMQGVGDKMTDSDEKYEYEEQAVIDYAQRVHGGYPGSPEEWSIYTLEYELENIKNILREYADFIHDTNKDKCGNCLNDISETIHHIAEGRIYKTLTPYK